MAITQYLLKLEDSLKEEVKKLAKADGRSLNNYINLLLVKDVEKNKLRESNERSIHSK